MYLEIPPSPLDMPRADWFCCFWKRRKSSVSPARLLIPPLLLLNAGLTEGGKTVFVFRSERTQMSISFPANSGCGVNIPTINSNIVVFPFHCLSPSRFVFILHWNVLGLNKTLTIHATECSFRKLHLTFSTLPVVFQHRRFDCQSSGLLLGLRLLNYWKFYWSHFTISDNRATRWRQN